MIFFSIRFFRMQVINFGGAFSSRKSNAWLLPWKALPHLGHPNRRRVALLGRLWTRGFRKAAGFVEFLMANTFVCHHKPTTTKGLCTFFTYVTRVKTPKSRYLRIQRIKDQHLSRWQGSTSFSHSLSDMMWKPRMSICLRTLEILEKH